MKQRIQYFARLKHGDPMPENAKLASKFEGQGHAKYNVLIEIIDLEEIGRKYRGNK